MLRQKYQFKNYNWVLVLVVVILCGMGVLFINSADSSYTGRQFLGLLLGAAVMFALSVINYNFICDYSRIFYIVNLILLLLVEFVGSSAGGAKRWLNLGFTRIQPSELTKIFMIIVVAVYIQEHEEDFNEWKNLIDPILRPIKATRGLKDYNLICDASVNTPEVIKARTMKAKIELVPIAAVDVIDLEFMVTDEITTVTE